MMVVHMRAGRHTACGVQLWGEGRRVADVDWVNNLTDADCPECVMNALPLTIMLPEDGFRLT